MCLIWAGFACVCVPSDAIVPAYRDAFLHCSPVITYFTLFRQLSQVMKCSHRRWPILAGKGIEQFFFIAKTDVDCARVFPLLHLNGFQIKG